MTICTHFLAWFLIWLELTHVLSYLAWLYGISLCNHLVFSKGISRVLLAVVVAIVLSCTNGWPAAIGFIFPHFSLLSLQVLLVFEGTICRICSPCPLSVQTVLESDLKVLGKVVLVCWWGASTLMKAIKDSVKMVFTSDRANCPWHKRYLDKICHANKSLMNFQGPVND